jgi:hypothetical protein
MPQDTSQLSRLQTKLSLANGMFARVELAQPDLLG